jgi:hypothetical protein
MTGHTVSGSRSFNKRTHFPYGWGKAILSNDDMDILHVNSVATFRIVAHKNVVQ